MKAQKLKLLFSQILPHVSGFVGHKRMLMMRPMNGMIRAINFDPSAYDKISFYPSTLVMPLCVPSDHFSLLFGDRLRHKTEGEYWTIDLPNVVEDLIAAIHDQALPVLSKVGELDGFLELAAKAWGNPHAPKEAAFVMARAGQRDRAVALIDEYLPKLRLESRWEKDIFDISMHLRDLLFHDPDAAHRQLLAWEDYTIQKLGLETFR